MGISYRDNTHTKGNIRHSAERLPQSPVLFLKHYPGSSICPIPSGPTVFSASGWLHRHNCKCSRCSSSNRSGPDHCNLDMYYTLEQALLVSAPTLLHNYGFGYCNSSGFTHYDYRLQPRIFFKSRSKSYLAYHFSIVRKRLWEWKRYRRLKSSEQDSLGCVGYLHASPSYASCQKASVSTKISKSFDPRQTWTFFRP